MRVVLELALHAEKEGGTFQKEIAESQNVSVKYLDQIIASLKKAGLIKNIGGKKSGYVLTRPAIEITVYDVYSAFDNELAIIDCLVPGMECPRGAMCAMRGYWCELNNTIRKSMQEMNLKLLVERHWGIGGNSNGKLEM